MSPCALDIDLRDVTAAFRAAHGHRASRHLVSDRLRPSILQYDYLTLGSLVADVELLIAAAPSVPRPKQAVALDLGCGKSPYRELIEARGFVLKTLDIHADSSPDFIGSVEATGLPDGFADLVLCTQVLEHSLSPERGIREICRILRPGGHLIASAPHVWFYHPHPSDNWRFTQEGLVRLVSGAGLEPIRLLSQGGSALSFFQIVNFLLYGLLGKLGAPAYVVNNVVGGVVDRLFQNNLFCLNFAILARKPAAA
jgi:SAM-dependent methyltransferase